MIPLLPVSVADTKSALRTTLAARNTTGCACCRARHVADLNELLEHLSALLKMAAEDAQ